MKNTFMMKFSRFHVLQLCFSSTHTLCTVVEMHYNNAIPVLENPVTIWQWNHEDEVSHQYRGFSVWHKTFFISQSHAHCYTRTMCGHASAQSSDCFTLFSIHCILHTLINLVGSMCVPTLFSRPVINAASKCIVNGIDCTRLVSYRYVQCMYPAWTRGKKWQVLYKGGWSQFLRNAYFIVVHQVHVHVLYCFFADSIGWPDLQWHIF